MHDPRAVANLILETGAELGLTITNLSLQKLLYFCHGRHLTQFKVPLVSGFFEAWQHGPVHPIVYQCFKSCGSSQITMRAQGRDPLTGLARALALPGDPSVQHTVQHVLRTFGPLPAGMLVDISHAKGAPWHAVVEQAKNEVALGLRISNELILERFAKHVVGVTDTPHSGEPLEERPLSPRAGPRSDRSA